MGNAISKIPKRSPRHVAGMGKVKVDKKPKPADNGLVEITASVFFDGTGNNRTNTAIGKSARLHNANAKYAVVAGRTVTFKDSSYESFFSNVAIMEHLNLLDKPNEQVSYYTEGIGTQNGLDDDNLGSGFGAGPTGIPTKVAKGIVGLTTQIEALLERTDKKIGHLTVNVCGFSRGAAAARHFVARRTAEFFPHYTSLSGSLGITADKITINFVGLFDTVSSYGGEKHQSVPGQIRNKLMHKSFDDDVQELHLAIGNHAKQVVQLAAADEYRKNFASTNIQSSVRAGVGLEVCLPGVHSDIGGSYEEHKDEWRWVTNFERPRLIEEGWYTKEQLANPQGGWWIHVVRKLTHVYQFIPLSIMVALAKQSGMRFKPFKADNQDYQVPAELQPLGNAMYKYVLGRPGPRSMQPYSPAVYDLPEQFHWVRNQYMHRSALQGEGVEAYLKMGGRFKNRLPDRQIFPESLPH